MSAEWSTNQPGQRDFLADFDSSASLYAGGWGCVAGHTRIETSAGPKRIDELFSDGKPFVVMTTRGAVECPPPIRCGVARLLRICYHDGRKQIHVTVHPRHMIWGRFPKCLPQWAEAEDLRRDDEVAVVAQATHGNAPQEENDTPKDVGAKWTKILGVVPVEIDRQYFDIHVPFVHHYIAHGLIHHNSGKTWAGARKLLLLHQLNRCPGMAIAPTWGDVWRIVVPAIQEAALTVRWPVRVNRGSAPHLAVGKFPIWLFSGDAPERITGVEVGHGWVDEAARLGESRDPLRDAPTQLRGRIRHPDAKKLHLLATTTHEGSGTWVFRDWYEKPLRGHRAFLGKTSQNSALPPEYLESRIATLSANLAAQYLDGGVADIAAGRAHPGFSRELHVSPCEIDPRLPVHIGMDFNVAPLCWVMGQVHGPGNRSTARIIILDEVAVPDHATIEQGMQLAHAKGWGNAVSVNIHPDASAKNRSTTGNPIATEIARIARSLGWPVVMRTLPSNPPINARIALLDALVSPWSGPARLMVHPKCERLIREMLQARRLRSGEYDPGKGGDNGHILDAIGYLTWNELRPGGGVA